MKLFFSRIDVWHTLAIKGRTPMLKRVKIQGYKSLADVEVNLQPLSVLFGPNASGKSNFLDALQLLSRIATGSNLRSAFAPPNRGTPLESFTFGKDGIRGLLTQEKATFSIEVDVELSQRTIDAVNQQIRGVEKLKTTGETNKIIKEGNLQLVQEKFMNYRIELEILPASQVLRIVNEVLKVDNQPELVGPIITHGISELGTLSFLSPVYFIRSPYLIAMRAELMGWNFFYLEPRERMRERTPLREVQHIGLMGEDIAAYLHTLRAIDEPQFRAVERTLHMMIPSINGIETSVNNSGEVELSLIEGNTSIPSRVLSEGTLRILGLLALSGAKEPPSLLGFEEPENGIQPGRLRLVSSILETRSYLDTQVIVTTHSPTLIDIVPRSSLYVCRKKNGRTSIEPFANWEYPEVDNALEDEDDDIPESTVSERLLRGDFDA
jgi:predicted ATPase